VQLKGVENSNYIDVRESVGEVLEEVVVRLH